MTSDQEFSFHEMEEIKRRLTATEAPPPSASIAPSGATVPLTDAAPQEFFSRSSRSDVEALQLKRAIRVMRRHWIVITLLALILPGIMFLYDAGLNHPKLRDRLPFLAAFRASQVYAATVRVEVRATPLPIGSNIIVEVPVDKGNLSKILESEDFRTKLNAQLAAGPDATADAAGDSGTTATTPPPGPKAEAQRSFSLRAGATADGVATVSIIGPHPQPLDDVADALVTTLNAYLQDLRAERFAKTLEQYRKTKEDNNNKLVEAWTDFDRKDAELRAQTAEDPSLRPELSTEFSLIFNLKKEKLNMELELYRLQNTIRLYKQKVDYDAIAKRLAIAEDTDVAKVLIQGNPLRMEWQNLELELARLSARYTDDHPRIVAIHDNITSIREALKAQGEVTSLGRVPDLPKPMELEALRTVEDLNDRITQTTTQIATIEATIAKKSEEARAAREKAEQEAREREDSRPSVSKELLQAHKEAQQKLEHLRNKDYEAARKIIDLEMLKGQINIEKDYAELRPRGQAVQIRPNVWMDVSVALLIGIILGLGVAFLLESMDSYIHTPTDIYYHLRLNYLGVIPRWSDKDAMIIAPERPDSHIAEIFAHLCNNIRYGRGGNPEKRLLVASATQAEGKSTIAANIAIRYALEGNSVVLIDADLRRPRGHKLLDIFQGGRTMQSGLADYLSGDATYPDVLYGTSIPGLSLIPAGSRVRNAAKLLGAPAMLTLLDEAERNFDIMIIDCPAVLPVVDATILAPHMRGILMVIAAEEVEIGAVRMALYRLLHVGAPMAGAVLNKVQERSTSYTYYGYRYRGGYYYSPYSSTYGNQDEDDDEKTA